MLELNVRGYVKQRESQVLEFKESFRYGDSLFEYARSLVGMANNQGGSIVFGVRDKPHEPVGLSDNRFEIFDAKALNKVFLEYFSGDVDWHSNTLEFFAKRFGVLSVSESKVKPIVCTKNHNKKNLREGAIYFRYRGETKEIRGYELVALLQSEREKEKLLWMKHIQSIAQIGPQSAQILDTYTGQMNVSGAKIIIDKQLVGKLNLIKEGQFSEKDGAPTLRLVGDLESLLDHDHVVFTENAYPHTQGSILEAIPIGPYEFQALVWKMGLKGDPKYHAEIKTGKKGAVQKYSERTVSHLKDFLRTQAEMLPKIKKEYSARKRGKDCQQGAAGDRPAFASLRQDGR